MREFYLISLLLFARSRVINFDLQIRKVFERSEKHLYTASKLLEIFLPLKESRAIRRLLARFFLKRKKEGTFARFKIHPS